jgi:ribosome biogenesis protein SLX9
MAVKKRNTLRAKSSKRVVPGTPGAAGAIAEQKDKIINKIAEKQLQSQSQTQPQPQGPTTVIKSTSLANTKPVGISKSALRRRKRKLRDELRPKLTEDLLDALTESTQTTINKGEDGVEEIIIQEKVKLNHAPNPHNKRGEMALFKIENEQFKQVLKHESLRKGGLSALRDSILANMANNS